MHTCFVLCAFGNRLGSAKEQRLYRERMVFKQHIFPRVAEICKRDDYIVNFEDGADGNPIGEIKSDTARRIDQADVVILIASPSDKPNAWIELGWADGFWHTPVILMREKFKLPADYSQWISVSYSERSLNGADEDASNHLVDELADRIMQTLKAPRRQVRFQHFKETTVATGQLRVYNRFSKAFSFPDWSAIIQAADKEIIIASPRMFDMLQRKNAFVWKDTSDSKDASDKKDKNREESVTFDELLFRKALLDQVPVTVMMYHPNNYSENTALVDASEQEIDDIRRNLNTSYDRWAERVSQYRTLRQTQERTTGVTWDTPIEQGFRIIRIRNRYLPYRVTLTEKRAITTLRFYSEAFNSGPCIESWPNSMERDPYAQPFYEHIRAELQFLIDANARESEQSFNEFLQRSATRQAGE